MTEGKTIDVVVLGDYEMVEIFDDRGKHNLKDILALEHDGAYHPYEVIDIPESNTEKQPYWLIRL